MLELYFGAALFIVIIALIARADFLEAIKMPPEKGKRLIIRNGGSLYLADLGLGRVLDIGRGLTMTLQDGIIGEVNQDVLTWEGRRRVIHSAPKVINMSVVKRLMGDGDGALPPLLPGGQDGSFLPTLTEFKVIEDE